MHITVIAGPSGAATLANALFLLYSGKGQSLSITTTGMDLLMEQLRRAKENEFAFVIVELSGIKLGQLDLARLIEAEFPIAQVVLSGERPSQLSEYT